MNSIQLLIKEICEEENINFSTISNDWILVLEKDGENHYIVGSKFDLNNYASAKICNDKYACFSALEYHNIPVCHHHIFYEKDSREEVEDYFNKCNGDVVVKANTGSYGNNMYHVTNIDDLIEKMKLLFKNNYSISISPFYNIKLEYRVIVLNNKVLLIFGKKRPVVVGNGKNTVYELLLEFNKPFFEDLENHTELDYVLESGKEFEYSWQHNLAKGAIPIKITDKELIKKLESIAVTATQKLNLNFVSVDIVELIDGDLKIIEINSGVVTNIANYFKDGDIIAKNIYREAILAMFNKKDL